MPIGNGSLGGMIFGDITEEVIGLNEETLWSGYYKDKNNTAAYGTLETVRQLIFNKHYKQAEALIQQKMLGECNESYVPLGNLRILFEAHTGQVSNYKRCLDLETAVVSTSYIQEGVSYRREYFSSYPHQALLIQLSASKPVLAGEILFESKLHYQVECKPDTVVFSGQCPEHIDPSYMHEGPNSWIQGDKGLMFEGKIEVLYHTGTLCRGKEGLKFSNADCIVLALSCVKQPRYKGLGYEAIKAAHIKDYQRLYNTMTIDLGAQYALPTDERLKRLKEGEQDNGLYGLYFQYGRYLMIASSREGSLPANLQGIWSWDLRAPWSSNWTTNINLQMNYWPVQSCNLTPCVKPYIELVKKLCEEGKKTAQIHYRCRGTVHHHNADYWCNTSPVGIAYGETEGWEGAVT